ncbi:MAG: hypothetical protein B6A08_20455 [Sorangiineae bacterium NIC37A_2]|nr:MAG: hypothetical protein B6A08_20455 [Sorangiineae bacterium NIC37A_2]
MSDTNQYTYPVGLTPEDRAQVEDLHAATLGIPRGTLLRALIRMSLPAALERPEVLGPHLVRNKGTPRVLLTDLDELRERASKADDLRGLARELAGELGSSVSEDAVYQHILEALKYPQLKWARELP